MTKAESLENACLDMKDYEKIGSRQPPRWRPVPACAGKDDASSAAMGRNSEKILSSLELHAVKNSLRYDQALQQFFQHLLVADNPLVADAEVDEALTSTRSIGVQQLRWRHSAWSNVPLFSGVRETRRTLLATQPSRPPGLAPPHPAQEQGSSRVVHMVSAGPGIPATWALEHAWATCYFRPGEPLTKKDIRIPIATSWWCIQGHDRLWPNRLWPKPTLAQTDFGPNRLWPNRLWPNRFLPKLRF